MNGRPALAEVCMIGLNRTVAGGCHEACERKRAGPSYERSWNLDLIQTKIVVTQR